VHAQTGQALGDLRAQHALGAPRQRALMIVIDMAMPAWRDAVAARARDMIARGFIDEVRGLIARHGPAIKPLRAVGYRQVAAGLARNASAAEIEHAVVHATRLYGKRQRNWFRSDPSVDARIDVTALLEPPMRARIRDHLGSRR
jgi:tRNA dimethylallyltransferase